VALAVVAVLLVSILEQVAQVIPLQLLHPRVTMVGMELLTDSKPLGQLVEAVEPIQMVAQEASTQVAMEALALHQASQVHLLLALVAEVAAMVVFQGNLLQAMVELAAVAMDR
jgi:hypothetical protein